MNIDILFHIGSYDDICLHFYLSFIKEIIKQNYSFSIYVTINNDQTNKYLVEKIIDEYNFPSISKKTVVNIGADIKPFLDHIFNSEKKADFTIKLHTKKLSL